MLDDRLTSAGSALREAPVPEPRSTALDQRRRQHVRRRVAVAAAVVTLLAGSIGAIELVRPEKARVRVVDEGAGEIQVPTPVTPAQLLPVQLPSDWHLTGWSERTYIGDPTLWLYGEPRLEYTTHPYVAVFEMPNSSIPAVQPGEDTVLVHGTPARIGTYTRGLRTINFGIGSRILTVVGWRFDDETLRRVAEGIVDGTDRPGGLDATWLPDGIEPIALNVPSHSATSTRTFEYGGPGGSLVLTTETGVSKRIEPLLWDRPGTQIVRRHGVTYGRLVEDGKTTLRWVANHGVPATVSATGLSDGAVFDVVEHLEERSATELVAAIGGVPSDDPGSPSYPPISLGVPVFDDEAGGHQFRVEVYLARGPDGNATLCERFGSGAGCGRAPGEGTRDNAALEPSTTSGEAFATVLVRDDVATVAVHYRAGTTRVYRVVRPFPGYAGLVGVAQPTGTTVELVEGRSADGTVLGRLRGMPTLG